MGPNDVAKINRAIRINEVPGGLMLAVTAVSIVLVVSGIVSFGPRVVVWLVFGLVPAVLTLWTARSIDGTATIRLASNAGSRSRLRDWVPR